MARAKVTWQPAAKRSFARLRKDDREGTNQVLDAVKHLERNPRPPGAQPYGKDHMRMRVGFYRVLYEVVSEHPVIVSVEHLGRSARP